MNETDIAKVGAEIVKESKDTVTAIAKEVYGDLAKPGVQQVGTALGELLSVARLATLPFRMVGYAPDLLFDRYKIFIENTLKKTDPKKVKRPKLSVATGVIDNVKQVFDQPELQEMYENLLAKDMNEDTSEKVHPGFVDIIKQLSPTDALVLTHMKHGLYAIETYMNSPDLQRMHYIPNFPTLQKFGFFTYLPQDSDLVDLALNNLVRLNLIKTKNVLGECGECVVPFNHIKVRHQEYFDKNRGKQRKMER